MGHRDPRVESSYHHLHPEVRPQPCRRLENEAQLTNLPRHQRQDLGLSQVLSLRCLPPRIGGRMSSGVLKESSLDDQDRRRRFNSASSAKMVLSLLRMKRL